MSATLTGSKAALLDSTNTVINVLVWDDSCTAPDGLSVVVLSPDIVVSPGWISGQDGTFYDPNPPAAPPMTPEPTLADLQAQLATLQAQLEALAAKN